MDFELGFERVYRCRPESLNRRLARPKNLAKNRTYENYICNAATNRWHLKPRVKQAQTFKTARQKAQMEALERWKPHNLDPRTGKLPKNWMKLFAQHWNTLSGLPPAGVPL